jgi:nucleoid-associated protein YgaU
VSQAPAAKPPAEGEAGQAGDRPQGDGRQAQAAAPAAANPDSTEPPAASKLEIARGEEAAAGRRRPADGEEEEAPARPRQAPTAGVDTGEAPEEAAAARKREEPPPPALPAEPSAPEHSSGREAQEAKAADAHSDKQVAAAPSAALLPQRLQSAVARPTARGDAGGSGSQRCQLAGVEVELPGWYVVKKGDTLWAIAKRHYGAGARYRGIYEANRSQLNKGPDWILPCQRLYLPPRQRGAGRP